MANLETFSGNFCFSGGLQLSNDNRPYLRAMYHAIERDRRAIFCCARQTEKSTTAAKVMAYFALANPGVRILYVAPRQEQVYRQVRERIWPLLQDSPLLRKLLWNDKDKRLRYFELENGSTIISEAAFHSPNAIRGITAEKVFIDEFQDFPPGCLPVIEEVQSHTRNPQTLIFGTARFADNELEKAYWRGTANIWTIRCVKCSAEIPANGEIIGIHGYICPRCKAPIDPRRGYWKSQNPGATWGASFRLGQVVVPWVTHAKILEKRQTIDPTLFANEVLAEAVSVGDLGFRMEDLEACCQSYRMLRLENDIRGRFRNNPIAAGIDFGHAAKAATSVCLATIDDDHNFHVLGWDSLPPGRNADQIIKFASAICRDAGVDVIGADAMGHGHFLMHMLFDRLQENVFVYSINYTENAFFGEQQQTENRKILTINRTKSIGSLAWQVRSKRMQFPRVEDCGQYFKEIVSERAVPDEEKRAIKYVKSSGQPDDALHAMVYAHAALRRAVSSNPYF
jgi:hypothetical protein